MLLRPELLATDSSSLSADGSSSLLRRLMTIPLPSLPNIELHITNVTRLNVYQNIVQTR